MGDGRRVKRGGREGCLRESEGEFEVGRKEMVRRGGLGEGAFTSNHHLSFSSLPLLLSLLVWEGGERMLCVL